jgi:hypothetical protein
MSKWFVPGWLRSTRPAAARPPDASTPVSPNFGIVDALQVLVLVNFAVAQPLYDLLGRRTAFLLNERIGLNVLIGLTFVLSILLPGALILLEWGLSRFSRRAKDICHTSLVFLSLFSLTLPIINRGTFIPAGIAIGAALICCSVATWCFSRIQSLRMLVTCAAAGVPLFPAMFLFYSPASHINGDPSSSRTSRFDPVPVVVLVCDEFCGSSLMTPQRTIDANRFPNFAALASQGTWFRNATSVHQSTLQAVPAILSGRYPLSEWPASPVDLPQNLFSVLDRPNGYQRAAFEPVSVLAPAHLDSKPSTPHETWRQSRILADALWRVYLFHLAPLEYQSHLPVIPPTWFGMNDSQLVNSDQKRGVFRYGWGDQRDAQFRHFLNTIDGSAEPTIHFMHMLLPHMPWCFLPSGQRYSEDGLDWHLLESDTQGDGQGNWGSDELEVIQGQQHYLLQVMYVDRLIGQLVARLKETGQYDRCLLIVTADHGISFRTRTSRRQIVPNNRDEIMSIPFFVKRPGQVKGGVSDRAVESIDILPTIADVVGLDLHGQIDGWSVFDAPHPHRSEKSFGVGGQAFKVDPAIITESKTPGDLRRRFGNSSDPKSLFRIGPIPELVGKSLADVEHSGNVPGVAPVTLEFNRFHDEADLSPGSELPCLFEGKVRSPQPSSEPVVLAVVVNGTIEAVTRTYRLDGYRDLWSALVDERAFHARKNEVKIFSVTGTAPNWHLSPCLTAAPTK